MEELEVKLPWKNTEIDRKLREKQWASIDVDCNGFLSLVEISLALKVIIKLPALFEMRQIIKNAFRTVKLLQVIPLNNLSEDQISKQEY